MPRDEGDLIDRLRELDRDHQEVDDPRWERLCRGAVSDEEREALERESGEMFEVFRPFDERAIEQVIGKIVRETKPAKRCAGLTPGRVLAVLACVAACVAIVPLAERRGVEVAASNSATDSDHGSPIKVGLNPMAAVESVATHRVPSPDRWAVEFSGCESVRTSETSDPLCVAGRQPLILWATNLENSTLSLEVNGAEKTIESISLEGGQRIELQPPSAPGRVKLIAKFGDQTHTFELAIAAEKRSPSLELAEQLRQEGKLDDAQTQLLALTGDRASPADRARATGKLARIAKRRGQAEEAVALFERAIELDRAAGLISDAVFDSFVLSLVHITRQDFAAARAALARTEPWERIFPQGRAMGSFYRGLLHAELGELWEALASYERSRAGSRRLGLVDHEIDVLQQQADILARLGRADDALRSIAEAERLLTGRPWRACTTAQVLTNRGETNLRTRRPIEAIEPFVEARQIYAKDCPDPTARMNIDIYLSLATLSLDRLGETRNHLAAARREPSLTARQENWLNYLEGRLALEEGHSARALAVFDQLTAELPETDSQAVHAATGRARALEALGRGEDARLAYQRADALIDRWSLHAPLEGAGLVLEGTAARIEFLVRSGALAEAVEAARAANSRGVRVFSRLGALEQLDPDARAAWESELAEYRRERSKVLASRRDLRLSPDRAAIEKASEENRRRLAEIEGRFELALARSAKRAMDSELRAPARGELLLVFHPLREGWIGFAISDSKISAQRLKLGPSLAPFRELFAGMERARVSMPGYFALSGPVPIVFGLDIEGTPKYSPDRAASNALLVSASAGTDDGARLELQQVAEFLAKQGWRVDILSGAAATRGEVERRLAQPELALLHYIGPGDRFGLALAEDESLGVSDILAMDRVPPIVVLSGSSRMAALVRGTSSALSAPQAFVLAGARSVVTAAWESGEEASPGLMSSFYRSLSAIAPQAITGAIRTLSASAVFRVFEP